VDQYKDHQYQRFTITSNYNS